MIGGGPIATSPIAAYLGAVRAIAALSLIDPSVTATGVEEYLARAAVGYGPIMAAGVATNDSYVTFHPGVPPTIPLEIEEQPRYIANNFGDGYQQTLGDGVNFAPLTVTVSFTDLTLAQKNSIVVFMAQNVGVPFLYQLPGEATPRIWTGGAMKTTNTGSWFDFQVTLTERFDSGL